MFQRDVSFMLYIEIRVTCGQRAWLVFIQSEKGGLYRERGGDSEIERDFSFFPFAQFTRVTVTSVTSSDL
jgi:hypothetical protein